MNYYLNTLTGDDVNPGTKASPWKSLANWTSAATRGEASIRWPPGRPQSATWKSTAATSTTTPAGSA